jgi:hypothetical protein
MVWSRFSVFSSFIVLTLACVTVAPGQITDPAAKAALSSEDQKTIKSFQHAAKSYLDIHDGAPAQAQLKQSGDVADLDKRRDALKQAIRTARPNAKQGDLFTPQVAALFRKLLAKAMRGSSGNAVRHSLQDAEPTTAAESSQIAVNHDYPNQEGQPLQSAPATLLQHLPILPKGLEYRMVGQILVLRDTEANIVVDFLPNALK